MRTRAGRVIVVAVAGFAGGAILGHIVALGIRSDNLPFLVVLGSVIGLCIGLAIGFALDRWHAA